MERDRLIRIEEMLAECDALGTAADKCLFDLRVLVGTLKLMVQHNLREGAPNEQS